MEHHAVHGHRRLQVLKQVPRNRFPFAIFVRCQIQRRGVFHEGLQVLDDRLATFSQLIRRFETILDIDSQPLAW